MLASVYHVLARKRIILASSSPRRQELIKCLNLDVETYASAVEEDHLNPFDYENFPKYVEAKAQNKAEKVYNLLKIGDNPEQLVIIAAHTVVTLGSEIFNKPVDRLDAIRMLNTLAGKYNRVHTAVCLKHANGSRGFIETSDVYICNLTDEQIEHYVDSGEGMDHPGGYDIQGIGSTIIPYISGDYNCIMGLPISRLCSELVDIFEDEEELDEDDDDGDVGLSAENIDVF